MRFKKITQRRASYSYSSVGMMRTNVLDGTYKSHGEGYALKNLARKRLTGLTLSLYLTVKPGLNSVDT